MATLNIQQHALSINPLDIVEQLVERNDWAFDRRGDDEIAVQVPGTWCDYSLFFAWNEEVGAMHFSCAFDMRVPPERRPFVHELLAMVNEKMWMGHFGLWADEGLPMFRHAMPMRGTQGPTREQIEDLVDVAILECERFYPTFQYVIWGGNTAAEAIAAAMVETLGEA
ncbi:MAG: YbjN domain-containing protein [Rhodospirillales bacterium]|nr:YbjN domain-containing protein [Rhodospirillales bacterium]